MWRRLLVIFMFFGLGGGALAAPTTPTADFTDNGDGTATHNTTGLMWKRCSEGQTWNGGSCTGTAATYTWAQAVALTSTFVGKSDWRLPTVRELQSIAEMEAFNPAINGTIFPNTPASYFWSASSYAGGSDSAWVVYFDYGNGSPNKTYSYYVRLVRGGQSFGTLALNRPTTDYVDHADGTVTHAPTQLTWKRCAEGQAWSSGACTGAATVMTWTQAAALTGAFAGKSDWRLPTVSELRSLVDFTRDSLAINSTIFPNTPTSNFWSASGYAGDSDSAWYVNFYFGNDYSGNKANYLYVRLVRGGQSLGTSSPTASLNGLTLSCPSTLTANGGGSCSATATYSDASSKSVAPSSWSLSGNAATLNSSGVLTGGTVSSDTQVTVTATYAEGGITQTAIANVLVKAAAPTLSGLGVSCPATLNSGNSAICTATAGYGNGSSNPVSATWTSSNSAVASMNGNTLTAGSVTTDTPVSISASYSENGITKTATAMVAIKAAIATLTSVVVNGSDSLKAGDTAAYSLIAIYSDGSNKPAANVNWSATGNGATIDAQGVLTGDGKLTAETNVTVTASYTENGITKTAQKTVTIKVNPIPPTACNGTGANLSGITIAGNSLKKLGESLDVSYCLKNFNSASKFDIYVAVQLPDGNMLFLRAAGFFGTPSFVALDAKKTAAKYLENTLIPDKSGSVLSISVLPLELPTGTYTFYAIPVLAGRDVWNGFNWVGNLASAQVNLIK
ncbi:MAG: DUF1566 domain-containing protein [Sulfuricellaceae bacterium]